MQTQIFLSLLLLNVAGFAETLTFDSPERWSSWAVPKDVVWFSDEGELKLKRYRKNINAVSNAQTFIQPTQTRGEVAGGIWQVGSGSQTAENLIDGDLSTTWRPNQEDTLVDWVVTVDLGRPVLAERIRLHFVDEKSISPFSQFSVFTSTGARIESTGDLFKFSQVYTTSKPNKETFIDIQLEGQQDTARVIDENLSIDWSEFRDFRTVRFIRFRVDKKSENTGLAEIEVIAAGDNISLGVVERGGKFGNGLLAREPQNMFDGIMDTYGNIFTVKSKGGWRESGVWWEVDLGALFWLDELFIYWQDRGEGLSSFLFEGLQAGRGYELLFSEGQRTLSGDIDYTPLIYEPAPNDSKSAQLRHHRYSFAPRKVRYLFWHSLFDEGWFSHPMELMLFSPGFPAQVNITSNFIDLGAYIGDRRPKAVESIHWQADLPLDTKLQLRSRSGNTLQDVYTFYDRKGEVVTETRWSSIPKVLRGPVDTTTVVGSDWGEWSNYYQYSGEPFKSETPRRYVQLELIMSSDDYNVAPSLKSLSIDFRAALVQVARGRINPSVVDINRDIPFVYTLYPFADAQDNGFDRLRLKTPNRITSEIELFIGGKLVVPHSIENVSDSVLVIDLPETVFSDSISLAFETRVFSNATVIGMDLGKRSDPLLWQSVEPAERRSNVVYLPALFEKEGIVTDVMFDSVFSPNQDGINDVFNLEFVIIKVQEPTPTISIFDISGRYVAKLSGKNRGGKTLVSWDGIEESGATADPGLYLYKINPEADTNKDSFMGTFALVY